MGGMLLLLLLCLSVSTACVRTAAVSAPDCPGRAAHSRLYNLGGRGGSGSCAARAGAVTWRY